MASVNLDALAQAATLVDDGDGEVHALVERATGMIHLLNHDDMDDEAPVPGDQATVREPFRDEQPRTQLRGWCERHGLQREG